MFVGPGSINLLGVVGGNPATVGTDIDGIVYSEFGFATPFINVGPEIATVGAVGGWTIGSTGNPGTADFKLIAQENTASGPTGTAYILAPTEQGNALWNSGTGLHEINPAGPTGSQTIYFNMNTEGYIPGLTGSSGGLFSYTGTSAATFSVESFVSLDAVTHNYTSPFIYEVIRKNPITSFGRQVIKPDQFGPPYPTANLATTFTLQPGQSFELLATAFGTNMLHIGTTGPTGAQLAITRLS